MILVNILETSATNRYNETVPMVEVPRVGDHFELSPQEGVVLIETVIWTPRSKDYAVQIRFRRY